MMSDLAMSLICFSIRGNKKAISYMCGSMSYCDICILGLLHRSSHLDFLGFQSLRKQFKGIQANLVKKITYASYTAFRILAPIVMSMKYFLKYLGLLLSPCTSFMIHAVNLNDTEEIK